MTLARSDFRFELRPYDFTCVNEIYAASVESRNEIAVWMGWMHDGYQFREAEDWVARCILSWDDQTDFQFVIFDRLESRVAGSCGLDNIHTKDRFCNLGYWVRTSSTRLGAATQATLLLRDFGLKTVGLNRLEIVVAEGNQPSRRVAEKAGAIYEGLQRRRIKVREHVYHGHMYVFV